MAGGKEIRTKIKSVKNTQKITRAMEMVATSKMRRAQERMRAARPYADKVRNIAAHMGAANPEYRHPFLVKRDKLPAGYVGPYEYSSNVLAKIRERLRNQAQAEAVPAGTSRLVPEP